MPNISSMHTYMHAQRKPTTDETRRGYSSSVASGARNKALEARAISSKAPTQDPQDSCKLSHGLDSVPKSPKIRY